MEYSSRPIELKKDIDTIFALVESPARLKPLLEKYQDRLPIDTEVELGTDEIAIKVPMAGLVVLKRTEVVAPNRVKYETTKSPVPASVLFSLAKEEEQKTLGQISVDAKVPVFLSGMVKGKVEPALAQIAGFLEEIDFDRLLKDTPLEK